MISEEVLIIAVFVIGFILYAVYKVVEAGNIVEGILKELDDNESERIN